MGNFPMTPAGFKALHDELKHLKTKIRPAVIRDIAEARSHGDLSENAEYDAAKEKQAFVEARIRYIEGKLARAQVIDTAKLKSDKVVFGATVKIYEVDSDTEQTWTIVGEDEADLKNSKVSIASPLARALVGKSVGDELEIITPKGVRACEIIHIYFISVEI